MTYGNRVRFTKGHALRLKGGVTKPVDQDQRRGSRREVTVVGDFRRVFDKGSVDAGRAAETLGVSTGNSR